ncbi:meiosis 1 arrest protein [Suncus etruscus]|uniref:meiosis 1 arrest protein n=1 Tax=Suncus etruscus TaxID=109475 RepID=UPI00210F3F64|nr:meiosis 1 arrest protein [Suncus etruscus]
MHQRRTTGKGPSPTPWIHQQPPRILIVHSISSCGTDICSNLCEALQNFFSLACNLMGPSRMSLFSLYIVQNQYECILPFVQVKGNFARLQACISELHTLQREGCFRPQSPSLQAAIEDGLQQFRQYSRHVPAGAGLNYTCLEITIITSHPRKEIVKQLEEGLKDTDLLRVRKLQVVEITKGALECMAATSPDDDSSNEESSILGTDIDLQTIDNDIISIEVFFKDWLHNNGTDQEHIHILLPSPCFSNISGARDNSMCLRCDLQERILSPSLLPGTADSSLRMDDPKGDFCTLYQLEPQLSTSPYKLRVIKALKSSGFCESLTYGLPFILRPTSFWRLDWNELETNQQHFHALCHILLKREWLLLAKGEPQSLGTSLREPASTFYIILPSRSATLLVKAVATREMMLPNSFPLLPEDPPDDSLKIMESTLAALELEPSYNPLDIQSHLYLLMASASPNPHGRLHPSLRKTRQMPTNRVRATVAPLPMIPAMRRTPKMPDASRASSEAFSSPLEEEEEEEEKA